MNFQVDEKGSCEILRMSGRLDLAGAEDAEKFFGEYRAQAIDGRRLIVSFGGVPYISSSGLRVLVAALNDIKKAGGDMVLCGMNIAVEEVFQFAGLDTVFRIYPEEKEAFAALAAS
ncbi:STAS domain-containing protein [Candidatus Poribacteria bacterium]|nr:STAS domain-containing protein [Candidatus Poribacteria bacterium]